MCLNLVLRVRYGDLPIRSRSYVKRVRWRMCRIDQYTRTVNVHRRHSAIVFRRENTMSNDSATSIVVWNLSPSPSSSI